MGRKLLLILVFLSTVLGNSAWSQLRFYESTFNGGVVGGGYSVGAFVASGSGSFDVNIPAGSTIRKAYLIAGRCGNAPGVNVTLNGQALRFDNTNVATTGFWTIYGGISAVHAIEVTSMINPSTSHYTISVPTQNLMMDKYADFYLYIAFQNASYPQVTSAIYLNTTDLSQDAYSWTLSTSSGINTSSQVGLAIFGGYAEADFDCEQVTVAGVPLGSFGGRDYNGASAWGVMAGFQYYNNTLVGYMDDNADAAIDSTDALANIQGLIPNGSTTIPIDFTHCTPTMDDNHVWALFLTHGNGVPLADHHIDLQAQARPGKVHLRWSVSEPQNIRSYELQRSADGSNFATLHTAEASAQQAAFDYDDTQAPVGRNWYRVRAIDMDGGEAFSDVELVELDGNTLAKGVSPNPVSQRDVLHVQLTEDQPLTWTLYQPANGSQVRTGQHSGGTQFELPTAELSAGSYALQLRSKERMQVLRFVVN